MSQNGSRGITVTTLLDVPSGDVIRHHLPRPEVAAPRDANDGGMQMAGRELRLVDVVDVNSPDEVGPPELYAWLHYDPIPDRDDLAKAWSRISPVTLVFRPRCVPTRASAPPSRT